MGLPHQRSTGARQRFNVNWNPAGALGGAADTPSPIGVLLLQAF